MVETSSNAVVEQWLKIIGSSLLMALGLFLILEAFVSLELWQAYTKDGIVHEFFYGPGGRGVTPVKILGGYERDLPILDNTPLLIFVGLPSIVIGMILVTKGVRKTT